MTPEQELLATAALTSFRLNGRFLALADELTEPVGLTAAWWQVLGAVLHEPLPVSGIARAMGLTRQSVQRIADLLVDRGLASYADNPAHARAKLVVVTDAGLDAVRRIDPGHREAAERLVDELGPVRAQEIVAALTELAEVMDEIAEEDRVPVSPDGAARRPVDRAARPRGRGPR